MAFRGQKVQLMKLAFCFAVLKVAVNGLDVEITCPKSPVKIDAHTNIECKVNSSAFAKITWFHDGQPITKQTKDHVTADMKTDNQTLKITFAKTTDSGNYTCQVASNLKTVSKTCNLKVKGHNTKDIHIKYVKIIGNRQKALLQGTVKIECNLLNVAGAMWIRNGTKITNSERYNTWLKGAIGEQGINLYLRIINVIKDDEGPYTCIGDKNGISANKTFYLQTEPCSSGYYCPPDGNTAIPCPTTTYIKEGENNSVSEEMKGCITKENNPKTPVSARSRGSSFCSQGYMLTVIYTVMTFMWMQFASA